MGGAVHATAWDMAVESVEDVLRLGAAPSLEHLGRLGQLGPLPSFIAALAAGDDAPSLTGDYARERETLGLAPEEIAAELLALGRVLDRHGEDDARGALDRCVVAYVERVTSELSDRARRDPLTGLLNHRAFHARVGAEAARARRYRRKVALLLFDLDRFKETNDREGHAEGDRLLRVFATALASTTRETDAAGRIGGDEFAALLLEADAHRVAAFERRLGERLPAELSVSAGSAVLPNDAADGEQLFAQADRRLYACKQARAT